MNKQLNKQLCTVQEIAKMLQVSPAWVREHSTGRRRPVIPSIRLGRSIRFDPDKVKAWLDEMIAVNGGKAA